MKFTSPLDTFLLEALTQLCPQSSRNTLRSWIQQKRVSIEGRVAERADVAVKKGQVIAVGPQHTFAGEGIEIYFEDKDLIVIYKPEGLLSVATDEGTEPSAHEILKRRLHAHRVFPVHRLDRETSGVMVFACKEGARDYFKDAFEKHVIEREYLGVVEGRLTSGSGSWKSRLIEDDNYYVKSSDEGGKLAITHYEVLEVGIGRSLVRFTLETGRKNQIRVHCKEAGYPIAGDRKYGAKTRPIKRLCLHAQKLGFVHPTTGKKMCFEAPAPSSFYEIVS